jgi:hypothetical protein
MFFKWPFGRKKNEDSGDYQTDTLPRNLSADLSPASIATDRLVSGSAQGSVEDNLRRAAKLAGSEH